MKRHIVIGSVLLLVGISLFAAAFAKKASDTRRMVCSNNLTQLGLSLLNFESMRGACPPAVTFGPDGSPWHSWRTLVSEPPGYRFDEPWNSPHNLQVAETSPMADLFRCPSASGKRNETTYFMVVGEGFLSDGRSSARLRQITDGLSDTVALLEVEKPGVLWTEPTDISFEELLDLREKTSHSGGSNVLFVDGRTRFLDMGSMSPDELEALLTIGGGEIAAGIDLK